MQLAIFVSQSRPSIRMHSCQSRPWLLAGHENANIALAISRQRIQAIRVIPDVLNKLAVARQQCHLQSGTALFVLNGAVHNLLAEWQNANDRQREHVISGGRQRLDMGGLRKSSLGACSWHFCDIAVGCSSVRSLARTGPSVRRGPRFGSAEPKPFCGSTS